MQREATNGSSKAQNHKHSNKHKEHKHRHRDRPEAPGPEEEEPQGKPWLAEHILVKVIDKTLQGGRCGLYILLTHHDHCRSIA